MLASSIAYFARKIVRPTLAYAVVFQLGIGANILDAQSAKAPSSRDNDTSSPIKHVIVIIGENRSFDHVFATYVPKSGETVKNLLSEGIINADGTPGPNFSKAEQKAAFDQTPDAFLLSPEKANFPKDIMPAPLAERPAGFLCEERQPEAGEAV